MTEKFRNKYRVGSARLSGYDYTRNGAYYITICTIKHICLFGDVVFVDTEKIANKIKLSDEGKIVADCWFDLPNHYLNIILDEFIVMPNHIHGIIMIQNYSAEKQKHGLSEFVRAFKSFSSRRINELRKTNQFGTWQSRYYDHIIHSVNELDRIRTYIRNNPDNWLNDKHYIQLNNV